MSTLAFGTAVRDEPIESIDQLVELHRRSFKPASRHRVGLELEDLPTTPDGGPVPYDAPPGSPSIRAVLERYAAVSGLKPVYEAENLIGLDGPAGTISLEPGGQVEFSSAPARTLDEVAAMARAHFERLRAAGEAAGVRFVKQGHQPFFPLSRAEWMPKARYRIMRAYLPGRGRLAPRMMSQTGAVQASFDYADDRDLSRKFHAAHLLTPVVQALFANSPFRDGRPARLLSYRTRIWQHTDPERCGLLRAGFGPEVGPEDYVRYALDVPMMFLIRGGRWVPVPGTPFRSFMRHGHEGSWATLEDWGLHLSGIFTHVRLKGYIEVRAHDLVPEPLALAAPALWKGVLYDAQALDAAIALFSGLTHAAAMDLLERVARCGLRARWRHHSLLEPARELVRIAAEGLRRQCRRRPGAAGCRDEAAFLAPLEELLARGLTPAEELLQRYHGEWNRDLRRAIA